MEGLLSEWIHLEWKNRREHFRRCCSNEPPQADVVLAAVLGRVLLWGYPLPSPLGVRTARYTELGMFFFPGIAAFFPLFKKILTCMFACTRWLCLLTKLCNMQKLAFVPPYIYAAPGETQKRFTNQQCGVGPFAEKQMQPSPWGHVTATRGQQHHRTRGVNIRYIHLFLGFSIPVNASECLACVCSFSGQKMLPLLPTCSPISFTAPTYGSERT